MAIRMIWEQAKHVPTELAPWIAPVGNLKLFVQPVHDSPGRPRRFRVIVHHDNWVLTHKSLQDTLEEAQELAESLVDQGIMVLG